MAWEYEVEREYDCNKCLEYHERLEKAGDFFEGIVEELYGGNIDNDNLEWLLDQLGGYLERKLPLTDLKIESKRIEE